MAEVYPFKALTFDPEKSQSLNAFAVQASEAIRIHDGIHRGVLRISGGPGLTVYSPEIS